MAGGSSGQQGGQMGGQQGGMPAQQTQAVGSNYNPYSTGGFQNQYQPQNQQYQPWMQQQNQNWNPYAQQQQQFQQPFQSPYNQGGYGMNRGMRGGYGMGPRGGYNPMADDFGIGGGYGPQGGMPPWANQQPAQADFQKRNLASLADMLRGNSISGVDMAQATPAPATPAANPFDSSQDAYNTWLSQHKQPTYEDWSQGINKQKSQYDSMMAQIGQDVARQIQSPYQQQQQPMYQQPLGLPARGNPYLQQQMLQQQMLQPFASPAEIASMRARGMLD